MARDLALSSGPDDRIFKSPWPALDIGLALTAASALWYPIFKTFIGKEAPRPLEMPIGHYQLGGAILEGHQGDRSGGPSRP